MKRLDVKVIGSSSAGNAYWISDGGSSILLDAGLPIRDIQRAIGFGASELSGALITHEHGDHSKAVHDLAKIGVTCYASQGTLDAIGLHTYYGHISEPLQTYNIGTFKVMPFDVDHDAAEPLGFLIVSTITGARLLYVTDTFQVRYNFERITHVMIECNYLADMVMENFLDGSMTYGKRLYANHMELDTVVEFLRNLKDSRLQEVYLLHLSDRNSDEKIMKQAVQEATGAAVYVAAK